jgi:hypothetical protein
MNGPPAAIMNATGVRRQAGAERVCSSSDEPRGEPRLGKLAASDKMPA